MVTTGHLVHRQAISASSGQNELGKTRPNWSMLSKTILSNHMTSLSQYFQNITTLLQHFNVQCTNSNVQCLNSNIQCPKSKLQCLISWQLNFLTILPLLELDSEAAPSCFKHYKLGCWTKGWHCDIVNVTKINTTQVRVFWNMHKN